MAENCENGEAELGLSWAVKVLDASKDGEVVKFTIQTNMGHEGEEEKGVIVLRQYEDLEWLYHCLIAHNSVDGVVIPPLPPKPVTTVSAAEAKSKRQLGKDAKNMVADEFSRECRNMEKFLQLVVSHPAFSKDEDLQKFLKEENPPVRTKVKKGVMESISRAVGDFRHHNHKDLDEEFQKKRDFVEQYTPLTKETFVNFTKMVHSQQRKCLVLPRNETFCQPTAEIRLNFDTFSSSLNGVKESFDVMSTNDDNTLGFTLELYSRYMEAAKEMLFRRTCKLVEFENATKALEKAKPKNQEALQKAKEDAEEAYNAISEIANKEMTRYNRQRVLSLQASLVQYAESRLKNGRDTYAILAKLMNDLKKSS
ncbi:sorting nexin-32-like [Orbicella faveolata]|uniref:sorting nexin-32-like n=1 Tax=Orbicella faveolata TaxID=48498 RepID=UPI0009E33F2D|nr:sorting nexin-32-like [Orbicella faveolata]